MVNKQRVGETLYPFGITCNEEFWGMYNTQPWVFTLVNIIDRLAEKLEEAELPELWPAELITAAQTNLDPEALKIVQLKAENFVKIRTEERQKSEGK